MLARAQAFINIISKSLGIIGMVVLASVISATLAARGIVRSKVTRILREAW